MKFVRTKIREQDPKKLRALGARVGWLIESPETIRVGFGPAVDTIHLDAGLQRLSVDAVPVVHHELVGDDGPPGSGVVAFGSLPFERSAPARLDVAQFCITQDMSGNAWLTSTQEVSERDHDWQRIIERTPEPRQETQELRSLTFRPTPDEYAHNVALAVAILRRKEIDKVVLARAILGTVPEVIDVSAVAQRLRLREPICTLYAVPTTGARRMVGASPELLVRRTGSQVQCHPLAGTIALPANVAPDDYETWLLGSTKNLHEHAVVVDEIVQHLATIFDDITLDAQPSIVTLRTVAHLGTWIRATFTSPHAPSPDALSVLRLLHPTAAVGGIPRQRADELIRELERYDRGHYAGPVGWIDERGDGEWWIALRGVLIDGAHFEAWAGAGIVSESDPAAEREETRDKMASILSSVLTERV